MSVLDGTSQRGVHPSHQIYLVLEADAILRGQAPHSHLQKPAKKMFLLVKTGRTSKYIHVRTQYHFNGVLRERF
jgi:hypothetical protein